MSDGTPTDSEIAKAARDRVGSWTLSSEQAVWAVAETQRRRVADPAATPFAISQALHKELWSRRGWYPSAVEVGAIVDDAFALPAPSLTPSEPDPTRQDRAAA